MSDFIFDGPGLLIIEPPGTGDTSFDVDRDLYSAWKRWVLNGDGSKYPFAFETEGGTPIGATGKFTGSTFIMVNGWRMRGAEHDHILSINGNLFSEDNILNVPTAGYTVLINVVATTGAQGIATGTSALTTAQAAQLKELHQVNALDAAHPVTIPKSAGDLTTGAIDIQITDNGDSHTLARQ